MMDLNTVINLAKDKLGKKIFSRLDLKLEQDLKLSGFKVNRENKRVEIFYSSKCTLFRALTLVKERINEKSYSVKFKRNFNSNGYMVDCSRNGVVNLATLKELIIYQALMGQDKLLLYTEDTYKLEKYPFFGYFRGGYTKEELTEVVEFGESFGVTLVPCIQTLGHLARPLHWEPMIPLRDGPSTLLIDNDETYSFIEEMIKFSREVFKSNEIHIGMDESTEIGLGRYLEKHKFTNRVELFSRHLDKVIKICSKYDFTPMIWSDMYFRLNTPNEEYYREEPLPKETLKLIPKGVELVYWDYYHEDKKIYDRMNKYHLETKRKVVFAGGAWRWKGFTPSLNGSFRTSRPAIESCLKNKIEDVFVTAWGDNGNECSIWTTLPIIALYSVADYEGVTVDSKIDSLLKAVTGDSLELFSKLDLPDTPAKKHLLPQYNPSKYFLYQDPLSGIFDDQVKDNFSTNYLEFANELKKASKESINFSYMYLTLSELCSALSLKVDLGVKLRKAYKEKNKKGFRKAINSIPELIKRLTKLNELSRNQWNSENKSFGFDVLDGRMGYLINRLKSTYQIGKDYLKGKIKVIEELEVTVLPYNGHDYEICWNWWATTVTTHTL